MASATTQTATTQTNESSTQAVDVSALQAEVQKWQERVPKLAAALRERTEELDQARAALRELQSSSHNSAEDASGAIDVRLATRDELIRELESKLSEAATAQRELSGQLHTCKLESTELAQEVSQWKDKWQSLSKQLDASVADEQRTAGSLADLEARWQESESALLQQHQDMQTEFLQEIKQLNEHIEEVEAKANKHLAESERLHQDLSKLQDECASLRSRNKHLQTSAELANNQMDSMGQEIETLNQSITEIREDLNDAVSAKEAAEEALAQNYQEHQLLENQMVELRSQSTNLQAAAAREVQDLDRIVDEAQSEIARLQNELVEVVGRLTQEVSSTTLQRDTARHDAQHWQGRAEEHQAAASSAAQELDKLKSQLQARSDLVQELEAELNTQKNNFTQEIALLQDSAAQSDALTEQLTEANNRAQTHQMHAQNLEAKLQQQMELLNELETELSQSGEHATQDVKDVEAQLRRAQTELVKLSTQNQELQAEIASLQQNPPSESDAADSESEIQELRLEIVGLQKLLTERSEELQDLRWRHDQQEAANSESVVLVLNQQLKDARDENERLLSRLSTAQSPTDDLTEMKGVGAKLARQLRDLGYASYADIAELTAAALEEADHPLYSLRSRIVRDEWIDQARAKVMEQQP